jgi:serine/threonine protein kinase
MTDELFNPGPTSLAGPPGAAAGKPCADVRRNLAEHPTMPVADLVEMLCADQVERWHRGERVPAEAYLQLHPALAGDTAEGFALVYTEFALREQGGEPPTEAEFAWRFPQFADRLRRQRLVRRMLEDPDDPLATRREEGDRLVEGPVLAQAASGAAGTSQTRVGLSPVLSAADRPAVPGYEILSELGRGGMGVVYKAQQVALKRTVALKMILAGAHAPPEQRARFRSEAEAVARLQHPHIVQIYEVGEHQGLPFFSLEYVDGGSLAKHLTGTPQPPHPAARLVEMLARAMQHAHERGIVHRDLKPANILLMSGGLVSGGVVSGEWSDPTNQDSPLTIHQPKITDFGLAKHLEEAAGVTGSGTVMGTPSYMAPEQARGQVHAIGPAADVYSLGAILYEMLTGRPPFQATTAADTVHQVITEEPVAPTRLQPRVPRDLETICLKCLEKDPQRRYASAQGLAEDLRRFQASEPIVARPASRAERFLKWARRRPALAALLGVIGVAAVIGLGGAIWYNTRLRAERDRAETNFHMALRAVDDLLREVGAEGLAREPHMEQTRRRLLEKALAYFQSFLGQASEDPLVRKKVGQAYKQMGDILRLLGRRSEAEAAYEKAINNLSRLAAEYPQDPEYRHVLAESYNWLGEVYRSAERHSQARAAHQKAAVILEGLTADFPDRAVYRKDRARSFYNLGIVAKDTNRPKEAEQAFDEAVAILRELTERFPEEAGYGHELALAYLNLSLVQARRDVERALATNGAALGLLRPLATQTPPNPDWRHELAVLYNNRALLLLLAGRQAGGDARRRAALIGRAKGANRRAHMLSDQLTQDFPSVPDYRKELANIFNTRGAIYYPTDKAEAERAWQEAAALWRQLAERDSAVPDYRAKLAETVGNLGLVSLQARKYREARGRFEEAVKQLRKALGSNPDKPDYRKALCDQYRRLAETLVKMGDHRRAAQTARELAGCPDDNGEGYFLAGCFLARCAGLVTAGPKSLQGQYAEEAVAMLQKALGRHYRVDFGADSLAALRPREDFQELARRYPR